MPNGLNVASIYAEAQLDISKFEASAEAMRQELMSLGALTSESLAEGLSGASPLERAAALKEGILSALALLPSSATSIGLNLSAGLAAGIRSGSSLVTAAARQVAASALQAAQARLEIHSPSRITERFGEQFDRGFILGLRADADAIQREVNRALFVEAPEQAAIQSQPQTAEGHRSRFDYDRLERMLDRLELTFSMNDRLFARATSREATRQADLEARRRAIGTGQSNARN